MPKTCRKTRKTRKTTGQTQPPSAESARFLSEEVSGRIGAIGFRSGLRTDQSPSPAGILLSILLRGAASQLEFCFRLRGRERGSPSRASTLRTTRATQIANQQGNAESDTHQLTTHTHTHTPNPFTFTCIRIFIRTLAPPFVRSAARPCNLLHLPPYRKRSLETGSSSSTRSNS